MNNREQLAQEQLETLPLPLQEAIKTISWKDSVLGIARSNGLDDAKASLFETETLLIIYGFEPQENYKANLIRELGLDEQKINTLIKEVEEEVFSPILTMANVLNSLNVPDKETEIEAPHTELEIAAPETEKIISEHTKEESVALDVEPEVEHKNINLIEQTPAVEKPQTFEPKPEPTTNPKSIVDEHLKTAVATTSKYVGGIDPYREPLN